MLCKHFSAVIVYLHNGPAAVRWLSFYVRLRHGKKK